MTTLASVLRQLGAISGTVHRCDGERLNLVDAIGIPAHVITLIEEIPRGKGMAGEAWLRAKPVTTCNLADDPNDVIQPGARQVDAQAAIAIPVLSPAGDVCGVVGFAFSEDTMLDTDRIAHLTVAACTLIDSHSGARP